MQAAVATLRRAHLTAIDAAANREVAGVESAWTVIASQVERNGWSTQTAIDLGNETFRSTRALIREATVLSRRHALAELRVISKDAASSAAEADVRREDINGLSALCMGMVERVAAIVGAAEHPAAAILAEAHQGARIVETEGFRAYNAGRDAIGRTLAAAGDGTTYLLQTDLPERRDWLPAVVMQWDATLDRRTCPTCRALDGKLRLLGSYFDGLPDPPAHPRCRCVLGYWPLAVPI